MSAFAATQLLAVHAGDPWHGPSRRDLLARFDAEGAAAQPIAGAHGAWALVLHMTAWTREVERRLRTGVADVPADGDFPALPEERTEAAWSEACRALDEAVHALASAMRRFPAEKHHSVFEDRRDPHARVTYAVLMHGIVQHDTYHCGQLALLRHALDG